MHDGTAADIVELGLESPDPPASAEPSDSSGKDGRTSGYDVGIAETICERLVNGESLRAICADPAMPARATVFRWLARNQEFRRSYALARQCHAEDFAFETPRDDRRRQQPARLFSTKLADTCAVWSISSHQATT
jgi:hypothetical protein